MRSETEPFIKANKINQNQSKSSMVESNDAPIGTSWVKANMNQQRKIQDKQRMAMQAAVDLGLSEHMTGKLFKVPSVTRVLKELRT